MKMIRDLWPIIFTELIQNIENENRNKDIHLLSESFKFIELLIDLLKVFQILKHLQLFFLFFQIYS